MEFSRQEYWRGLPFLSPGDLHDPGIDLGAPALQVDSLPSGACRLQSKLREIKELCGKYSGVFNSFLHLFFVVWNNNCKRKKCHLVSLSVHIEFAEQMWKWALEWEMWKGAEEARLNIRSNWTNADLCILDQSSKSYARILPFRTVCLRSKCWGPFNSCSAHPADMGSPERGVMLGKVVLYT